MPFKDIDWVKEAKRAEVSYNIGRANALINAKSDKNIHKVELLSGTDLVDRDPIEEAIQMEKFVREQQPIISKLTEISEKTISPKTLTTLMQNIPAIDYDRVTEPLAIPTTRAHHRRSKSDPITIDMNQGIDSNVIAKYKLTMPNDIIKEVAYNEDKLLELGAHKKQLENILKKVASKSKHDSTLKPELKSLQIYNEALKTILKNQGSIKKPATTSTSTSTSTSSGKGIKNRIYYTNPQDLIQRLSVLVGERQAGNKSKYIKNEIADISHHLYKNKVIKKKEYRNILSTM